MQACQMQNGAHVLSSSAHTKLIVRSMLERTTGANQMLCRALGFLPAYSFGRYLLRGIHASDLLELVPVASKFPVFNWGLW